MNVERFGSELSALSGLLPFGTSNRFSHPCINPTSGFLGYERLFLQRRPDDLCLPPPQPALGTPQNGLGILQTSVPRRDEGMISTPSCSKNGDDFTPRDVKDAEAAARRSPFKSPATSPSVPSSSIISSMLLCPTPQHLSSEMQFRGLLGNNAPPWPGSTHIRTLVGSHARFQPCYASTESSEVHPITGD